MPNLRNNRYDSVEPRSGTAGPEDQPRSAPPVQTRPPHLRSRSHLTGMSPVDPKPRNAVTMPVGASPPMHRNVNGTADKAARQNKEDESNAGSLLPRIHLPGHKSRNSRDFRDGTSRDKERDGLHGHHFPLRRTNSHRHTRSEVPQGSHSANESQGRDRVDMATNIDPAYLAPGSAVAKSGSGMISRVASNLSSKAAAEHKHKPRHQYSSSDVHKGFHQATAAALTGQAGRPDLRRRATSDPRVLAYSRTGYQNSGRDGAQAQNGTAGYVGGQVAQPQQQKPMSEVELLLYKAEKARQDAEQNVTEADVQKMSMQLAESNVELQNQLASTNRTASSLMRRLDDAHDVLLRSASSLIDTISSFQNLSQQSSTLIKNFENKASDLDSEMRATLEKHHRALFDERGKKVAKLEERGKKANERAEEMSKRLEDCRTMVKKYTERQHTKQRAWKGVLVGSLWGCAIIIFGVLLGFGLWWYKNYGAIVQYDVHEAIAMALDHRGLDNVHGHLHEMVKERLLIQTAMEREEVMAFDNVPDDVKAVLEDIAARHNDTMEEERTTQQHAEPTVDGSLGADTKLQKLFDKLEI